MRKCHACMKHGWFQFSPCYEFLRHGPDTTDVPNEEHLCSPPVNQTCEEGCFLSHLQKHCINEIGAEVYSAPIDIILWDFEGAVLFGKNWPMTTRTHPAITVLVYGNPVSSETRNADDVGDVFLNRPPERIRRHNPAPGLNLLDVSDFRVGLVAYFCYPFQVLTSCTPQKDIARDEFGCFNENQPTCPPRDHTIVGLTIAGLMSMLLVHHLVERRKNQDAVGCLLETEAAEAIAKEDMKKSKQRVLSFRVLGRIILLFLPLLALSPLILMFYLIWPRRTLLYIWILLVGRPKTD